MKIHISDEANRDNEVSTDRSQAPGFLYIKISDVEPEFRSISGVESLLDLVKIGMALDLDKRDSGYKKYSPMRFQTVFAVRVENCRVAERLALDHFAKFNVRREFDKSARQSMSPELAHVAQMVGVECFRIDLEAAKAVLRMIGEEVALAA
jgi:T5orf172 domain